MTLQKPFMIGLAGGSGSGKTTLAHILQQELPWSTTLVGLDHFYRDLSYLPLAQRMQVNFDHPDSLDFADCPQVVEKLATGQPSSMPDYDFTQCNPTGKRITVQPAEIVLLEGMQVLWYEPLLKYLDMRIFLNIDEQTRFARKLERDMLERGRSYADVLDMWQTRTKPMHKRFVQPGCMNADFVFTESYGPQVLEVVTTEIGRRIQLHQGLIDPIL